MNTLGRCSVYATHKKYRFFEETSVSEHLNQSLHFAVDVAKMVHSECC